MESMIRLELEAKGSFCRGCHFSLQKDQPKCFIFKKCRLVVIQDRHFYLQWNFKDKYEGERLAERPNTYPYQIKFQVKCLKTFWAQNFLTECKTKTNPYFFWKTETEAIDALRKIKKVWKEKYAVFQKTERNASTLSGV